MNNDKAKEEVASLVKDLVGNRTIKKTAEDTGVAASYISGMIKGRFVPSVAILKKLADPKANPQNGVTLEELMIAAGFTTNAMDYSCSTEEGSNIGFVAESHTYNAGLANYRMAMKEHKKLHALFAGIIVTSLSKKGIRFALNNKVYMSNMFGDLCVDVNECGIKEWGFEYVYLINRRKNYFQKLYQVFGILSTQEPQKDKKISLVVNDSDFYHVFMRYKDKMSFRGELSVILIDEANASIEKEDYISHYNEGDTSMEFYITKQKE